MSIFNPIFQLYKQEDIIQSEDDCFDLRLDLFSVKSPLCFVGQAAEAEKWASENLGSYEILPTGRINYMRLRFVAAKDAVAFKLRWL